MSAQARIENIRNLTLNRDPEATAIKFRDKVISYGDLELLSQNMSTWFTDMGLKGEPVALMLPNGPDIIIMYLACFKSGAIAMPLNRRYAAPEFKKALINSEAKCLMIEREKLHLLKDIDLTQTSIKKVYVNGDVPEKDYTNLNTMLEPVCQYNPTEIYDNDPAMILYTSGSTGDPKGVLHNYKSVDGILESTSQALEDINEKDRILVIDPLVHISGFIETFSGLYKGATIILDDFDIDRCINAFMNDRPTLLTTHNDVYVKILHSGLTDKDTFSSFRGIYTGGDALPAAFQKSLYDHSRLVLQLGYGMTEAIWLTVNRELDREGKGSIGTAIPGVTVRIIDKDGNDVEDGKVGEIWVNGTMVTPGYWKNEDETARALEDGWFKTGDCGYRDSDGIFYYSGRIKDIIIRNTSNITPGEVEQALSKNPVVKQASVIGVDDEKEGQVPVAFVVKKVGSDISEEELKEFTATQIAGYKIPAKIHFIKEMPLTSSGKIDHKKLYDLLP